MGGRDGAAVSVGVVGPKPCGRRADTETPDSGRAPTTEALTTPRPQPPRPLARITKLPRFMGEAPWLTLSMGVLRPLTLPGRPIPTATAEGQA